MDSLDACAHLRHALVRVQSINLTDSEHISYSVVRLNGMIARAAPLLLSRDRVARSSVCICINKHRLYPLSPFVEYRVCNVCNLEHNFFLERASGSRLWLHSYEGNYRIEVEGRLPS